MNFEFYKKLKDFNSPLGDVPEIEEGWQFFSLHCVGLEVIWKIEFYVIGELWVVKKLNDFNPSLRLFRRSVQFYKFLYYFVAGFK